MSMAGREPWRAIALPCLKVDAAEPWHAYFIPLESLPLRPELRPSLLDAVTELVAAIRKKKSLQRTVWLLLDQLHHENAVCEISRNAAIWNPSVGLGLRPENPPPRYWTSEDLLERDFGTPIPPLKHTVVLLDTNEAGSELACGLMTGIGGLFQTLQVAPVAQICAEWYGVFQPTIQEEGLAAYPLYAPILGLASVARAQAEKLSHWMSSVDVYIRESAEDKGVLILSHEALDDVFEQLKYLALSEPQSAKGTAHRLPPC